MTTGQAFIEMERDFDAFADSLRSYAVVIDGTLVGRLDPGERRTFEVTPGFHRIFLKIAWCRSEKVDLNLTAGQAVKLRCRPRSGIFTDLYWITLGRNRYISLTQVKDQGNC